MIPTPQVILSIVTDNESGVLRSFEEQRKAGDSSFSKFMQQEGKNFCYVFTSDEKANLLNFRTSFNMGAGGVGQSLITLEFIDPGGKFDHAFFGNFLRDKDYLSIVNQFLSDKLITKFHADVTKAVHNTNTYAQRSDAYLSKLSDWSILKNLLKSSHREHMGGIETLLGSNPTPWGQEQLYGEGGGVILHRGTGGAAIEVPGGRAWLTEINRRRHAAEGDKLRFFIKVGGRPSDSSRDILGDPGVQSTTNVVPPERTWRSPMNKYLSWEEASAWKSGGLFVEWGGALLPGMTPAQAISAARTTWTGEARFLESGQLSIGSPEYTQWVKNRRQAIGRELRSQMVIDDDYNHLSDLIRKLRGYPFTKDMWISFGMGDNMASYAPAQLVKLVKIDYGLTTDSVRKFTLHLQPSIGMLYMKTAPEMIGALTNTDRLSYKASTRLTDSKGNFVCPVDAVVELLRNGYSTAVGILDTEVEVLTFDLRQQIIKKYSEALISEIHEQLSTIVDIKLSTKAFGDAEPYRALLQTLLAGYNVGEEKTLQSLLQKLILSENSNWIYRDPWGVGKVHERTLLDNSKLKTSAYTFVYKVMSKFYRSLGIKVASVAGETGIDTNRSGVRIDLPDRDTRSATVPNPGSPVLPKVATTPEELKKYLEEQSASGKTQAIPRKDPTPAVKQVAPATPTIQKVTTGPFFNMITSRMTGSAPSLRSFLKSCIENTSVYVFVESKTPIEMKNAMDNIIKALDPDGIGREPYVLSFNEKHFLEQWWGDPTNNTSIIFIVSTNFYSALVKELGIQYINSLKASALARDKMRRFVAAYDAFHNSEPRVKTIAGFPDIYSYLSLNQRAISQGKGVFTLDNRGEIDSAEALEEYARSKRVPVLTYGFANSNVLDFQFDLKLWWPLFVNILPDSLKNVVMTKALGQPGLGFKEFMNTKASNNWTDEENTKQLEIYLGELWDNAHTELSKSAWNPYGGIDPSKPNFTAETPQIGPAAQMVAGLNAAANLEQSGDILADLGTVGANLGNNPLPPHELGYNPEWSEEGQPGSDAAQKIIRQILPPKKIFIKRMKVMFLTSLASQRMGLDGKSITLRPDTASDSKVLQALTDIHSRFQWVGGFKGTVTALPSLMQILSPLMIGRAALLYFIEPQILSDSKMKGDVPYTTWLSGEYWIMGYEATISEGEVSTSFKVVKKPYLEGLEGLGGATEK